MQKVQPFQRYAGASESNAAVRMPRDVLDATSQNMCIAELVGRLENFNDQERAKYPWADRFVMGYPLPKWQRPLVWTDAQKTRFIESIWSGVDIGSYMVNDVFEYEKKDDSVNDVNDVNWSRFREFSEIILDGQQRLSAIEDYVLSHFKVEDANGVGRYWSDLPKVERRRFCTFHFPRSTIKSWDEALLRKAYDLRAFGGTAHTEEQRASAHVPNPGFLVKGQCGREWFVPLEKVGEDYAQFLAEIDMLSPEDAKKEAEANREFWPQWFSEQCSLWIDIERLGKIVKKSTLFKTKAALDRRRGDSVDEVEDFMDYVPLDS